MGRRFPVRGRRPRSYPCPGHERSGVAAARRVREGKRGGELSELTATSSLHRTDTDTPERLDGEPATWDPPSWHGTGGSRVRRKARASLVTLVTGLSRALCCCGHPSGSGADASSRDLPSRS